MVGVLASAAERGAGTVAVTNDPGSPLAATADVVLELGAGPERSVAATKTYTAEIAALHQIIGGAAGVPWSARTDLLRRAADAVEPDLELHDDGLDAAPIDRGRRAARLGRARPVDVERRGPPETHGDLRNPASGWRAADATTARSAR